MFGLVGFVWLFGFAHFAYSAYFANSNYSSLNKEVRVPEQNSYHMITLTQKFYTKMEVHCQMKRFHPLSCLKVLPIKVNVYYNKLLFW